MNDTAPTVSKYRGEEVHAESEVRARKVRKKSGINFPATTCPLLLLNLPLLIGYVW
jgi:hypothetical protein